MANQLLRLICAYMLISTTLAGSKAFSCMSYMDDDKSLQDDDFDEYSSNTQLSNVENPLVKEMDADFDLSLESPATTAAIIATPFRKNCLSDYTFCFSLWRQTQNGSHIVKQGCWKESTERNATCSHTECTSSAPISLNNSLYYCCCSGDVCNQRVAVVEPTPLQLSREIAAATAKFGHTDKTSNILWNTGVLFWCMLFMLSMLLSSFIGFLYCRHTKKKPMPEEAPLAPSGPGYSSNLRNVDNINLICMLGSGKYGTVMKGLLHDQEVAVKIFAEANYQYYINERNIYSLPLMDCPALLTYFGYDERHTMEGKIEYQLVLSLAPLGCLQDWLIANSMDFEHYCKMTKSITRGLSHLHTELRRDELLKPCIAHRDLNSRNVLVKADLSCCIADFGFALKVFGSKYEYKGEVAMAETKSINEVGTLRYMAPELLEGAVNLRDCETSLKQMDVYALGLVIWEVATRCTDFYPTAQATPPYKAPYELEVGAHPSFDQMQSLVVRRKARPLFPAGWGGSMPAAKLISDTCEDCWDHDAEARLTSLCAEERMQEVANLRPRRFHMHIQAANTLSNTNNLSSSTQSTEAIQRINMNATNVETTAINPPPNQQIIPTTEKNHLIYPQQQLQPYQGRNPCQERNLAPVSTRAPQVLVEKSKKHSFQSAQENSFSCLEDDVSVEELISSGGLKKFSTTAHATSSMGQGFPKQHNTDEKLRGWHGVRALIQKKLFRKNANGEDMFQQMSYNDEKSNLVDHRYAAVIKGLDNLPVKNSTVSFIDEKLCAQNGDVVMRTTTLDDVTVNNCNSRRPNNLDLSPLQYQNKSNLIHSIAEERNANVNRNVNGNDKKLNGICEHILNDHSNGNLEANLVKRPATPSHLVTRSFSSSLIKNLHKNSSSSSSSNNNNNNNSCSDALHVNNGVKMAATACEQQFRRQHSLEVFREVFSGRGSTEKLRDPSQRVKTPGDVPPSVRKVRASKTLSLYDDRMMDSSTLNIL